MRYFNSYVDAELLIPQLEFNYKLFVTDEPGETENVIITILKTCSHRSK